MTISKHFQKRSKQRIGRKLKKKEIADILNKIRKGLIEITYPAEKDSIKYVIKKDNKIYKIIYNPIKDELITIIVIPHGRFATAIFQKRAT